MVKGKLLAMLSMECDNMESVLNGRPGIQVF